MSQMIRTQNGLKYTLSDDMYYSLMNAALFEKDDDVWGMTNLLTEVSANVPTFVGWLTFVILSFAAPIEWYMVVVYSGLANLCGYAIHRQLWLLKNPIVLMPLTLFNLLTFKRLDWISILAISIWQLHHWEAAPIYIVAGLVIMMVLFGSHESREYFNDSAAKLVIKMMKDKYGDE